MRRRHLLLLWGMAAGLALLGTAIAYDALPGVNWGIWTTAASTGLALATWRARRAASREMLMLLVLACALAFGATVTTNELFLLLIVAGTVILLATATLLAAGEPAAEIGALGIVRAPLVAGARAAAEAARRAAEGAEACRAGRSLPVMRGTAIAAPVVGVLALLLSQADPLLAAWRQDVAAAVARWSFLPRAIFFTGLGALALGAYGMALRPARPAPLAPPRPGGRALIGDTERLITLGAVAALFALFLGLQLSYLFGNAPARLGSGITYAEYARRGFGEITVAATIATALIIGLDRLAAPGARACCVRIVALTLLALVHLLLDSAYHRVWLYEQAYGYTAARLYAQAYMIVVSLLLVALAYEIWGGLDVKRLARRAAVLGTAALLVLIYWNHEAWIVRQNVERYAATGKLDIAYLTARLSRNAVPEVIRATSRLEPAEANAVRAHLAERYARRPGAHGTRWFEWNVRRAEAARALQAVGID